MKDIRSILSQSIQEKGLTIKNDKIKYVEEKAGQLPTLFDFFEPHIENEVEKTKYSNSIEVYDRAPKILRSKARRKNGMLDSISRDFNVNGIPYHIDVYPARIVEKGVNKDYLPQQSEELIEDILRKMAFHKGTTDDRGRIGVYFSLYSLRKELERVGHSLSIVEIKKSLFILSRCTVSIKREQDGAKLLHEDTIFNGMTLRSFDDWKSLGKNSECFIKFNDLVTTQLQNGRWRLYDYDETIKIKNPLARWFHKRVYEWRRATKGREVPFMLTTIRNDYGSEEKDISKFRKKIRTALEILKKGTDEGTHIGGYILESYLEEEIKVGRRVEDVKFLLYPSRNFESKMKRLNQLRRDAAQRIDAVQEKCIEQHKKTLPFRGTTNKLDF